jgi:hypothetical protein
MSEPTREQKRRDLARAMGWTVKRYGGRLELVRPDGGFANPFSDSYPAAFMTEAEAWQYAPNYFTSHEACHDLVKWLATQQRHIQQGFIFAVRDETTDVDLCYELRILTADPAIKAEAVWQAIQEKTKCTN